MFVAGRTERHGGLRLDGLSTPERFALLMSEQVSRTLFCRTSMLNHRDAGLEGERAVKCSGKNTIVFAHGSLRGLARMSGP
jgi:hypothetical protein